MFYHWTFCVSQSSKSKSSISGFFRLLQKKIVEKSRFSRIVEEFSVSKHFDFTFHFSKKSESILISLCTSRKRVKAFFSLCTSWKRVKAFYFHFSLLERKKPTLAGPWDDKVMAIAVKLEMYQCNIYFGCPWQLNIWFCHSVSDWGTISYLNVFRALQSCCRPILPFWQLIIRVKRHGMTNKKTKTKTKTKTCTHTKTKTDTNTLKMKMNFLSFCN